MPDNTIMPGPLGPYPGVTPHSREERLTREELWARYRLAIEALRLIEDANPDEPQTWPERLVRILMGPEHSGNPRITGSLADPCDANLLVYSTGDGNRVLIDVHPCVHSRGHADLHCNTFGELFTTGETRDEP